ncbi:hypothetical protein [Bifidobacterium miconisargentati]|uniref:hypothetical protein n=1 Tax=Bifidobacterium miconisargentati TaxID=2834437 RepID=UPI001BDC11C0|nr:hypothetical protein [Bifidobacterium miconisargentati]MBW3089203.1 hypothetical protein [Bifidobacterium miconisargentati]
MYGLTWIMVDALVICVMLIITAALAVLAFAIGLVTHPIRTIAFALNKLAGLAGGLALIFALVDWFLYDHAKPDFMPVLLGCIGVIVVSVIVNVATEAILDLPTRSQRRAIRQERRMRLERLEHEGKARSKPCRFDRETGKIVPLQQESPDLDR